MAVNGEGAHSFSLCPSDTGQTDSQRAGGKLREGVRMRGKVYRSETEKKKKKRKVSSSVFQVSGQPYEPVEDTIRDSTVSIKMKMKWPLSWLKQMLPFKGDLSSRLTHSI